MKSEFDDYSILLNIDRILSVYHKIQLNSKHKDKLFLFELFFSCNIMSIYNTLNEKTYHHQRYNIFLLKEHKYRIIMSEGMHDKIVNHLISKYVLFPLIEPKLIPMNVATREGMGTKMGIFYVKKYMNKLKYHHNKFYVLKCDISKYFYSIDHDLLFEKVKKIIKDSDLLAIVREIIYSTDYPYINEKIKEVILAEKKRLQGLNLHDLNSKFAELDRIPLYHHGKGLPIGNMSSQIFAIYYLNDLDHFIKEKLRIKFYVRYMDDFLLFHPDKNYLKYCLCEIEKKLQELKLKLNNKTQIIEVHHGFNFLGYRFTLRDKRLLILLNSKTKRRIKKKLRILKKYDVPNKDAVIASYKGYLQVAHSGNFCYQNHLYEKSFLYDTMGKK